MVILLADWLPLSLESCEAWPEPGRAMFGAELTRAIAAPGFPRTFACLPVAGEEPGRSDLGMTTCLPAAEAGRTVPRAAVCSKVAVDPPKAWELMSPSLADASCSSTLLKPSVSSEYLMSPDVLSDVKNLSVTALLNLACVSRFSLAASHAVGECTTWCPTFDFERDLKSMPWAALPPVPGRSPPVPGREWSPPVPGREWSPLVPASSDGC